MNVFTVLHSYEQQVLQLDVIIDGFWILGLVDVEVKLHIFTFISLDRTSSFM